MVLHAQQTLCHAKFLDSITLLCVHVSMCVYMYLYIINTPNNRKITIEKESATIQKESGRRDTVQHALLPSFNTTFSALGVVWTGATTQDGADICVCGHMRVRMFLHLCIYIYRYIVVNNLLQCMAWTVLHECPEKQNPPPRPLCTFDVQGGRDPQDALSLQVIFRKRAL